MIVLQSTSYAIELLFVAAQRNILVATMVMLGPYLAISPITIALPLYGRPCLRHGKLRFYFWYIAV
jgi:hypothetical protein